MYASVLCFNISVPSSPVYLVVVPMWWCRLFVVVLVLPIVLMRVDDIPISHIIWCVFRMVDLSR